jgi:hypothetical protein
VLLLLRGVRRSQQNCGHKQTLCPQNKRYAREYGAEVGWYGQGVTEGLGEKSAPVPLCPPQILHAVLCSALGANQCRKLIAWATARSPPSVIQTMQRPMKGRLMNNCEKRWRKRSWSNLGHYLDMSGTNKEDQSISELTCLLACTWQTQVGWNVMPSSTPPNRLFCWHKLHTKGHNRKRYKNHQTWRSMATSHMGGCLICSNIWYNSLDEWSARHRTSAYTGHHNTEKRGQKSMPSTEFKHTIPASERPNPITQIARPLSPALLNYAL